MDDNSPDKKLETSDYEFDATTTFLQIPVKIKEEVLAYVKKICSENEISEDTLNKPSPFAEQGCFFVIALEKIEDMIRALETSLFYGDREVEKMRAEVRKVINMLHGE